MFALHHFFIDVVHLMGVVCATTTLYDIVSCILLLASMSELSKMEEAEEQGFLEDVDSLQTPEEHAKNLAILKGQKGQRTKWVMLRHAVLLLYVLRQRGAQL